MTPTGFAFVFWVVVYAWQVLWVAYAWSFTCRPSAQRTIYPAVYVCYSIANCLNIAWLYLWGNQFVLVSCVILALLSLFLFSTIGIMFGYFHNIKGSCNKWDLWLTRIMVQNGLCCYCTVTVILTTTNLAALLPPTSLLSEDDCGTLSLSLLLVFLLAYFILENTVLDRFGFRCVVSVYPVVVWFLVTILIEQWDMQNQRRNSIFTLVLVVGSVAIFLLRVVLIVLRYHYNRLK